MITSLPNYRPFFSPFRHIPPREPFVKAVISMHKIIMAVTVEEMLICSNLGARSFRDGNQGICKYKESNMGQVAGLILRPKLSSSKYFELIRDKILSE